MKGDMTISCMIRWLAAVAVAFPMVGNAAEELQMTARRVALFKNGYACVQMRGTLPGGSQALVRGLPIPVFGTLDFRAPEGVNITQITAGRAEGVLQQSAGFLSAQAGRIVTITTKDKREYRGELVSPIPTSELPPGSFRAAQESDSRELAAGSPNTVVLRTARGDLVSLNADFNIMSIEMEGQPQAFDTQQPEAELSLSMGEGASGKPIHIQFLSKGLSWLPTYRLELQDDGQAHLVGHISVINDLLDLNNVELELVTGSPALGQALITSPMVRLVGLQQFLQSVKNERDWLPRILAANNRTSGGAYDTYRATGLAEADSMWDAEMGAEFGHARARKSMAQPTGAASARETSTQAEELTFYNIPSFSCKRGEVVERELFDLTVPYSHVYTCFVPDQHTLQRMDNNGIDIWHCVRLKNEGELPWSSGVVSCYSGGRFAARSDLPFTAAGQSGLLQLSKTLEATLTCRETETKREDKKQHYQGELILTNRTDHPMELELTKALVGTPTEASDGAQISVTPAYAGNPRSSIVWKLRLEPGQKKTCTYTYSYENN